MLKLLTSIPPPALYSVLSTLQLVDVNAEITSDGVLRAYPSREPVTKKGTILGI